MTDDQSPLVLLVGHCTPDAWMLRTAVGRAHDGVEVDVVNEQDRLRENVRDAGRPVVALVNRKLDGRFDAEDGIELMRDLGDAPVVAVLVSDLTDAHERAREVGGHPGFGKRAIHDEATTESIRSAIAAAAERSATGGS